MFCKLIVCANQWMKESTWKDLALVKFCLCAVGSILGLTVLRKNKKAALAISVVVFIATWLPLMKRFFEVVCRTLGSCRSSDGEPEKDEAACGCAAPAEEDFSCDLDLACLLSLRSRERPWRGRRWSAELPGGPGNSREPPGCGSARRRA